MITVIDSSPVENICHFAWSTIKELGQNFVDQIYNICESRNRVNQKVL